MLFLTNNAILKVPNFVLVVSYNRFACIKVKKKHFLQYTLHITIFFIDSQMTR